MKVGSITTVLGVAAVTMTITLALTGAARLEAVDPDAKADMMPVISQPTLEIDGIQIKLTMDKSQYAAGDEPILLLAATNPTDRRVETNVWLGMTASSPQSLLSRVPTMPKYLWTENCPIALEPGMTEHYQLNTGQKLVAGNTISVTMSDTDQRAAMAKLLELRAQPAADK